MIANKEEIRVGQVIVHILDSTVGMPVLSDTVLDYGSDFADFIKAHIFKTDNRPLFDFSLEEVKEAGWTLEKSTFDLHHSEYVEGNIMTEYEEKFVAKGNPICMLQIFLQEDK